MSKLESSNWLAFAYVAAEVPCGCPHAFLGHNGQSTVGDLRQALALAIGVVRVLCQRDAIIWCNVRVCTRPYCKSWRAAAEPRASSPGQEKTQRIAAALHLSLEPACHSRAYHSPDEIEAARLRKILLAHLFTARSLLFHILSDFEACLSAISMRCADAILLVVPVMLHMREDILCVLFEVLLVILGISA